MRLHPQLQRHYGRYRSGKNKGKQENCYPALKVTKLVQKTYDEHLQDHQKSTFSLNLKSNDLTVF